MYTVRKLDRLELEAQITMVGKPYESALTHGLYEDDELIHAGTEEFLNEIKESLEE